jgi:hypothetical protein
MAKAKPTHTPFPDVYNKFQVATKLNMSEGTFHTRRPKLERHGFPPYNDLLGGWIVPAIDRWLELQAGFQAKSTVTEVGQMEEIYD